MIRLLIRRICAVLGWLYRHKKNEDAIWGVIEGIIGVLCNAHNDIVDIRRNRYIRRYGTITGCIERYQYITSWQYLYGSALIQIGDDSEESSIEECNPINIPTLRTIVASTQEWLDNIEWLTPAIYDDLGDMLYALQVSAGIVLYHELHPDAEPRTMEEQEYQQAVYACIDSIIAPEKNV